MLRAHVYILVAVLILAAFTGCTATQPPTFWTSTGGKAFEMQTPSGQHLIVRATPSGQRVCAVHGVPLVAADGFAFTGKEIIDPGEAEVKALYHYPNFIQTGWSLRRTKLERKPAKILYCSRCEAEACALGIERI